MVGQADLPHNRAWRDILRLLCHAMRARRKRGNRAKLRGSNQ